MTYSLDYRQRAVAHVKEGSTSAEACRLFKIDPKTLYNWLKAKSLHPNPVKTRTRKIDKQALIAHVRDYPDALQRERAKIFGVDASAICRSLQNLKIVKKNDALR